MRWFSCLKAPVTKPDNLNSVPGTHMVEGEDLQPESCLLMSTRPLVYRIQKTNVLRNVLRTKKKNPEI